jgi:hypothetical protein
VLKSLLSGQYPTTSTLTQLLYDCRFTANQFFLVTSLLRLTTNIFFQLNTCGHSPYVTSSLTRGWVCRLQLLLAFATLVIFRSESHGTHDHMSLYQIRDLPICRARSPYLYPPGTGWPGYIPRHRVPFSSPPTTLRATAEVFEPPPQSQSQSYFATGGLPPISLSWRQAH